MTDTDDFAFAKPETATSELGGVPAQSALSSPLTNHVLTASAVAQLVIINILWGASSAATKYGLAAFGPCSLAVLRFLPAALLLFALCRRQKLLVTMRPPDRLPFFVLGFVGIALTYSILYYGVARTTASDASLLFACEPLLIALAAFLFLRERLRAAQWAGLLLGLVGIRLIAGAGLGNWIALLGLSFECGTSVIGKRLTGRYPGLLVVAWELLIGSLLLLPVALWEIAHHPPVITSSALMGTVFLALICTALCYGVWYRLMERFPVSQLAVFILIQPLCGPLWGWGLRGEGLRPQSALGGALVIAGIALTTMIRGNRQG